MRIGALTDCGKVRVKNEDAFGYRDNLFVVADGMGGHEAGEVASAIAVEKILKANFSFQENIEEELVNAILGANQAIVNRINLENQLQGMGTTIAVLLLDIDQAHLAHIGDSRIYRLSEKKLWQLTSDHSLVEELVKQGGLTREEARNHPQRNVLTRALGTRSFLEVAYQVAILKPGDKFLLCTDGLTGLVGEELLRELLAADLPPQVIANELVKKANELGGSDNITVIVIEL